MFKGRNWYWTTSYSIAHVGHTNERHVAWLNAFAGLQQNNIYNKFWCELERNCTGCGRAYFRINQKFSAVQPQAKTISEGGIK